VFWIFAGHLRRRRNIRDMYKTLDRITAFLDKPVEEPGGNESPR
jgi:hypothetical protein